MGTLLVQRRDGARATELAYRSCAWARNLGADAELIVGIPGDIAVIGGAFQRRSELGDLGTINNKIPLLRRGSGGGVAIVGPGTVWMQLALSRPDALVACTADKLINRYVRPLLQALTRVSGVHANYFGRDWISAASHPMALIGFAHEASSGRCMLEAFIAVSTPFAHYARPTFLGKLPATLEQLTNSQIDIAAVADAVASAYGTTSQARETDFAAPNGPGPAHSWGDPPWYSTREEGIGIVAAGPDDDGRFRIGGELMASHDAIARLETQLTELIPGASADDIGLMVDEALTENGAVTFGVKCLGSIRDVIFEARRGPRASMRPPTPMR